MKPSIAILTQNTLMGLGLKSLLGEVLPMIEISLYNTFEEFAGAMPERHVHFFVELRQVLLHRAFFEEHRHRTIILGRSGASFSDMHQIDIFAGEERLVHEILKLRQGAHRPEHAMTPPETPSSPAANVLSSRETEVLVLVAQGLINKEIADRLNIGLTTVITHRRNIMEKLGIKTVAGLTLYALAMGYIDLDTF